MGSSTLIEVKPGQEASISTEETPTIDDLPNEILFRILTLLDSKSINRVTAVSKTWHTIIDDTIGRTLCVGRLCQFVSHVTARYSHKYVEFQAIGEVGTTECYVGEVVDPGRSQTIFKLLLSKLKQLIYGDDTPQFKHPHLVKILHFDGPIPREYFESMLKDLNNLTEIEFHTTSFCLLQTSYLQNLKWKRLKSLKLWGHRLTDGLFTAFYPYQKIVPNLLAIMKNCFPSLSSFSIEYPIDIRDGKPLTKQLLRFLRHHTELEKLTVCVNLPSFEESQEFENPDDLEMIRDVKLTAKRLKLKQMKIIVSSMRRIHQAKLWTSLVEQQRCLQDATILAIHIPPQILDTICIGNKKTLQTLQVSKILLHLNGRPTQVDCSIFNRCENLRCLSLDGMQSGFVAPGLTSLRKLPKCLMHLDLQSIPLLHDDIDAIFFEFPVLNTISLTDVGNQEPFGVTVDTLRQVIAERKINAVTIYRSVCEAFPSQGISNGDTCFPRFICQSQYDILEFELNNAGYYENMPRAYPFDIDDD